MTEQNKTYQLACLFSPLLSSEETDQLNQKIRKEIAAKGGSFVGANVLNHYLVKKKLSYPINKHQEAFFLNLDFVSPAESISKIISQINSEKDVLRCLIIVKKERQPEIKPKLAQDTFNFDLIDKIEPIAKKEKTEEIKEAAPKKNLIEEQSKPKPAKEKVKIEELDKKLEEILNT